MSTKHETSSEDEVKENGTSDVGTEPTVVNGAEDMLSPQLLFDMNKKIAQLTKVVYGLNIRGEELENQLRKSRENEEKTRAVNADLQMRVNNFKAKIDREMGKLQEFENQAKEAQMWKREFENLQRRFNFESETEADFGVIIRLKDELDQIKRRESGLHIELEQARCAIANLKGHHDFIMRERDAQQVMESEKMLLEWRAKLTDVESRYKAQIRRMDEELCELKTHSDSLRSEAVASSLRALGEDRLRDQNEALRAQYEADKKEWEIHMRRQEKERDEEKRKLIDEKHIIIRRLHGRTDEKEKKILELTEEIKLKEEEYKERINDMTVNQQILQRLIDDKEDEFELRLKTKVVEWKSEWDSAEETLNDEIRKLKCENLKLQTEVTAVKFSMDNSSLSLLTKIQKLEDELDDKANELELKARNFKVRLGMVESENRQYSQEKVDLERLLDEERERHKSKLKNQETINEQCKRTLQTRLDQALDSEKNLKEVSKYLEEEVESLKMSKDNISRKIKECEKEWKEKIEHEIKNTEARVKQKGDRLWLEKLKKSEESATSDLQKFQEARKRRESSLRQEIEVAQNSAEGAKNISEELEQKLNQCHKMEAEKAKSLVAVEIHLCEMKKKEERISNEHIKEITELEQKYKVQIDEFSLKLAEKQREIRDLIEENLSLERRSKSNPMTKNLEASLEEATKQIRAKENMVERIKVELEYAKSEQEISKMKISRMEEEVKKSKESLTEVTKENRVNEKEVASSMELKNKIYVLENELKKNEVGKKELEEALSAIEVEREEELKIVQDALDEAAEEREELIATFEKELQSLNATNTAREQQMLEDFECKLREMEKDNKTKLDEKERHVEARINAVRSAVESEMSDSLTKVAEDRRIADEKLSEVGHLRSYEAEVIQLRGVTHEFQKALRASAREMENLKVKERLFEEEIRSLKSGSQSRQNTLTRTKNHSDEEDVRHKIEKMKSDINAQWEEKLRIECSRLKTELVDLHAEEKHLAVESIKVTKEQQIQGMKKTWEQTQQDMNKEISILKDSLAEKDAFHHKEFQTMRATSDREIWDLRIKIQKLSEVSNDKQQQMEDKYIEDIEQIRIDHENRISNLQLRFDERRAELEMDHVTKLVKEHREQMKHIQEQHILSMERLREELESEKFQAIEEARIMISRKYENSEIELQQNFNDCEVKITQYEHDLENLQESLSNREAIIRTLQADLKESTEEIMKQKDETIGNLNLTSNFPTSNISELINSQLSLASSCDSHESRISAEQFYVPEAPDILDSAGTSNAHGDSHSESPKSSGGSGLLGKVFGGSWFTQSKGKDNKKGFKKSSSSST